MATKLLTDDEVFGSELLSDADVFGPAPTSGPSQSDVRKAEPAESRAPATPRRGSLRGVAPYGAGAPLPADYAEQARIDALPLLERPMAVQAPARGDAMPTPDVADTFRNPSAEARAVFNERMALSRAPESPEQAAARQARASKSAAIRAENEAWAKGVEAARPGVYEGTLLDNAAGTGQLSLVKGAFQVAGIAFDTLRMLPIGDSAEDALISMSTWARLSAESVQKAKSRESRAQAEELAALVQDPNSSIATVAGFLIANPTFVAEMATESAPIIALTAGAGGVGAALAERLAIRAIGAAPATPAVARGIDAIRSAVAGQAAGATNVAMGAGTVYADARNKGASVADAYTAAGVAGMGYAIAGRLSGGGAEGMLARGAGGGAARGFLREGGQEMAESFSESAGMASLPTVDFDATGATKQALVEGAAGGVAGAGTGLLTRGAEPPTVDDVLRGATPAQQFADAFAADTAGTYFDRNAIDGFARAAMTPGSVLTDPNAVRPEDTRKPIQLEDQPTTIYTPDQLATMAASAPVQPAAPGQPAVAPGADSLPATPQAPPAAGIGIAAVPQGALAAQAQTALEASSGAVATTPAPAPVAAPVAPAGALDAPYSSQGEAIAAAAELGLSGKTQPVAVDGGFALAPVLKPRTVADTATDQNAAAGLGARVRLPIAAVPDADVPGWAQSMLNVARSAFNVPITAIRGLGERGVYYAGRAFVDVDQSSPTGIFLHTVGHESRHQLDASTDPADRAIAAKLNAVIDAYTLPGVVDRRQLTESIDPATQQMRAEGPVTTEYARDEVRADVNGSMWMDPEFWGQVYDIDKGSTARRLMYQFMRAATKFIKVAKGSRQDVTGLVSNVEAVRKASAEAWAQRAKNKASRKAKPKADSQQGGLSFSRDEPDEPDIPDDAYLDDDEGMGAFSEFANPVDDAVDEKKGKKKPKDDEEDTDNADVRERLNDELNDELAELSGRNGPSLPPEAAQELRDEFGPNRISLDEVDEGSRALLSDYSAVPDRAIKAAGLMPETAFPPLIYASSSDRDVSRAALVATAGKVRAATMSVSYVEDEAGNKRAVGWKAAMSQDANKDAARKQGLPQAGFGTGGLPLTERAAQAWAQRFAAAAELTYRGYDLLDAVPAAARKRVADTWIAIGKLPRAYEMGMLPDLPGSAWNHLLAQRAINVLLDGLPVRATATPRLGSRLNFNVAFESDNGKPGKAWIEVTPRRGRAPATLTVHAMDLPKGSAYGKPLYQIAGAVADALDANVEADEGGLTAINTYRRTEHMLSVALRTGKAAKFNAGLGQRIYGWDRKAAGEAASRDNLVRLALAGARNAAEFVPAVQELRYDLATDRFLTADGQDAEPVVQGAMRDGDVRAVSISRSTLARAAITFEAIRGEVDLAGVREIEKPVLYSRRLPDDHPHSLDTVSPAEVNASTAVYSELEGRPIRYEVRIEDTGQTAVVTVDGARALRELDQRESVMRRLMGCLQA